MVLFVSDIHFGKGTVQRCRSDEADLLACLRAHEDDVSQLFLVGDVFDAYIEYRRLVPKGVVRFQALLAEWVDRGVPVTYLVGNHDPWHLDYFEQELGVRVVSDDLLEPLEDTLVYVTHGDGIPPSSPLYRRVKPWLRHPLCVRLYRTLLPADAGLGLARWVNRRLHSDPHDPVKVCALRDRARRLLSERAADAVVMGHTHVPELRRWADGTYVNLGSWYEQRTFARLEGGDCHLFRWNGSRPEEVEASTSFD